MCVFAICLDQHRPLWLFSRGELRSLCTLFSFVFHSVPFTESVRFWISASQHSTHEVSNQIWAFYNITNKNVVETTPYSYITSRVCIPLQRSLFSIEFSQHTSASRRSKISLSDPYQECAMSASPHTSSIDCKPCFFSNLKLDATKNSMLFIPALLPQTNYARGQLRYIKTTCCIDVGDGGPISFLSCSFFTSDSLIKLNLALFTAALLFCGDPVLASLHRAILVHCLNSGAGDPDQFIFCLNFTLDSLTTSSWVFSIVTVPLQLHPISFSSRLFCYHLFVPPSPDIQYRWSLQTSPVFIFIGSSPQLVLL